MIEIYTKIIATICLFLVINNFFYRFMTVIMTSGSIKFAVDAAV